MITGDDHYEIITRQRREIAALESKLVAAKAMAELCARLREHFESARKPACPDPDCNYAGGAYPVHESDCAYVKYVKAQDATSPSAHSAG